MKQKESAFLVPAAERVERFKNNLLLGSSDEQPHILRFEYSSRLIHGQFFQLRPDTFCRRSEREDEKLKSFTREAGLLIDGRQFLLDVRGNIFFFQFSDGFFLIGMLYEKLRQWMGLFYFPRADKKKRRLSISFFHEALQKIEQQFFSRFPEDKRMENNHHLLRRKKSFFTGRQAPLHVIQRPLILEIKDEKLRSRAFFDKSFLEDAPALIHSETVFAMEKK